MERTLYGRIVFGGSAVLFGAIALMWHDAETWQNVSNIWKLPAGTLIGECLMIALIAGGIALLYAPAVRLGSTVLAVVFALFSLACVAGIVGAPRSYDQYGSFFEQFSLLSGAVAAYASTQADKLRTAALRQAARVGLGLSTVSFALAQIIYLKFTAELVPRWIPPGQMFWAILTTVAFALAAIALLTNIRARLAARLMTLMLLIFDALVWVPQLIAHPQAHFSWSEFALTVLIAGASWVVAEVS